MSASPTTRQPGPIEVLCAADAGYGAWLGVMIASLLRFDHGAPLRIHLMSDGIDQATLATIAAMVEAADARLAIYDVTPVLDARSASLVVSAHLSRASYTRVFFGEIMPPAIDRLVYLDVDLVCRGPIGALWSVDLGAAVAAVARDCATGTGPAGDLAAAARMARNRHARRIGLPEDDGYFNTGVMLIDVWRWRAEQVATAAARWTKDNAARIELADQDPLNAVLRGRVAWLDDRWNCLAPWAWREPAADVNILHFAGPDKPWHADYAGWGSADWLAAKAACAFRDVPLVSRPGRAPQPRLPTEGDGTQSIRVRATANGTTETVDGLEVIRNDPACVDVFVYGPHVALPPGTYEARFLLTDIAELAAIAPGTRKLVRFQICLLSGTKSIAMLDLDVRPGMRVRDVPVTVGFVLPGPVHDLECWLTASPGVQAALRSDVVLRRLGAPWWKERTNTESEA
jgi:UDP-glucose:(glucosyl)LPS alpha-1,3-glucosyltransferase